MWSDLKSNTQHSHTSPFRIDLQAHLHNLIALESYLDEHERQRDSSKASSMSFELKVVFHAQINLFISNEKKIIKSNWEEKWN